MRSHLLLWSQTTVARLTYILTEHTDGSGSLSISQRKRRNFTRIEPHVRKAHILQYDRGVVRGGRAKMQAMVKLWRDGDPELWVVDGHCDGAGRQTAFPGTLCQGEVGANLNPTLQWHVLPQHSTHPLRHHDLTSPDTCHRQNNNSNGFMLPPSCRVIGWFVGTSSGTVRVYLTEDLFNTLPLMSVV